jgi:hypothetical protein
MAKYRVIDSTEKVVAEKEFADATSAYEWFKTEGAPDDELGVAMQVEADGEWHMFEQTDGGTNTDPGADA